MSCDNFTLSVPFGLQETVNEKLLPKFVVVAKAQIANT